MNNTRLKELRTKNNFTYQMMANELNVSKTFYWQIEHGVRKLSYKMAFDIARIFGLKPDDIFYDEFLNYNDEVAS
ncbi:MAG: helix-turn-helix transcriptional regulator [Firmicutes bacterium]|nr:helix-turn-helix transcriptional regulator [Bacillota bacterium]